MSPIEKTFLLGVGAQKAGTTWVYEYLNRTAAADFGPLKEYHVLSDEMFRPLPRLRQKLSDLRRRPKAMGLRATLRRDPEKYFNHFMALLEQPGIRLTGDITPAYARLGPCTLAKVKQGFERRGVKVKVMFLMRDPVERCCSALRMHQRNGDVRRARLEGIELSLQPETALRQYIETPEAQFRTRYHDTLSMLHQSFRSEDIFVGFFENLFSEKEIERLSRFVGCPEDPDFARERFNTTQRDDAIGPETRRHVRERFREVYDQVAIQYPVSRELWADAVLDPGER